MKLQRSPAPKRIASSISSAVATPSLHQPQRLAPQRLQQPVGDEAVDLLREHERLHADRLGRPRRRGRLAAPDVAAPPTDLDQRHQVDRVERMADDEPFRMHMPVLHLGGQQARRRRAEHHVRSGRARWPRRSSCCFRSRRSGALSWTKSTPSAASSAEPTNAQRALRRQRRHGQLGVGAAGVVEDLADLARRLGVGVEEQDVDAVEQEPGGPAATDDTATEQADGLQARDRAHRRSRPLSTARAASLAQLAHSGELSCSWARTSAGLRTLTFMASRMETARRDEVGVGGELAAARSRGCPPGRRARCRRPATAMATKGICMRPIENAEKTAVRRAAG